jgi:hypothetical protein
MTKIILAWTMLVLAGCGAVADGPRGKLCRATAPVGAWRASHVVLLTIDGVRWQEIFVGTDGVRSQKTMTAEQLTPNLHALAARGLALGTPGTLPFEASGPNFVSLPGYREIMGAKPGCLTNECGHVDEPTLLDELRASGLAPTEVAAIGSWERLERAASPNTEDLAVSFGRHAGGSRDRLRVSPRASKLLDQAAHADSWPGHGDYRPDSWTASLALEYARVIRPRFMWVGLGDTDEFAHKGDYEGYLGALRRADAFVVDLMRALGPDTLIVVTTDHGRAANFRDHGAFAPESRAVWLVAAGPGIEHAPEPHRLAGVSSLIRAALGDDRQSLELAATMAK